MSIEAVTATAGVAAAARVQGTKVADDSRQGAAVDKLAAAALPDPKAALQAAVRQIDSYLKSVGRAVEFRVDEETEMTVVTVRNTATGEVIRQIPSEEVLQLARHLEQGSAVLLNLTA